MLFCLFSEHATVKYNEGVLSFSFPLEEHPEDGSDAMVDDEAIVLRTHIELPNLKSLFGIN